MPNKAWIIKIHLGKNQLGLSEEEYRTILAENFGVRSSKDLTDPEAERLVNVLFKKMGFEIKRPAKPRHPAPTREVFYHKSSMKGLREEIAEYARRRFGPGWERPLGALAERIAGIERLEWIRNLYHLKEIKNALLKLESSGPYVRGRKRDYVPAPGDPF